MAYIQDWGMRVQAQPQINTTRRAFLHLSQNENGRMLNIRITDVNIPSGSTAVLAGTKPDGTVYSQTGTLAGNTATFAEDVQMTAVAGTWDAKITITNGGNCICTARITITIDPDTVAGGAIPSDSQLDGIIAECRAIADSVRKEAYGSPLVADAVEDMTDQSRVYVYTGSESGMTAGHWYYYDGTNWTDGGVYNAVAVDTDTTLTIAGKAADAKKTGDEISAIKEDFNDLNEDLSLFGTTEASFSEVAVTTNNGQAVYNKEGAASNGNIVNSSNAGYCVIPVNAGERYFITTRVGGNYSAVAFFNSQTISKDSYIGSPDYQSSYTTLADYMVTIPTSATHMTVNTLNYTDYPISIAKLNVLKSVDALYEAGYGKQSDIDKILSKYNYIEQCQKVGDALVTRNAYMNGRNVITGANDSYSLTDYFEMKSGDLFFLNFVYRITVFNSNKEYVREISVSSLSNYSGSVRWNTWTATSDGYVRFSIINTTQPYWGAAVKMLNTGDYELVSLGDSLFGNNQKPYDLTTYIQNATNMKSANCGFGGTRASATTAEQYKPLCFCNIANAIHDNDWSTIDINWATLYGDNVFMVNKDILVNIDWTKVKIITVAFGTNDMNGNVPIDNENNLLDKTTYKGGLRYGIEKILSAYPQITIVMLSPLYRYRAVGEDYSQIDYDSDTGNGQGGFLMKPYLDAMREVAEEYHLPFFDNYNGVGLNKLTAPYWLRDGTHLNYTVGPYKIGSRIGEEIASVANNNRPKD